MNGSSISAEQPALLTQKMPGHGLRASIHRGFTWNARIRLGFRLPRVLNSEARLLAQVFFARQGFSVQQAQTLTLGAVTLPRMLMYKNLEP